MTAVVAPDDRRWRIVVRFRAQTRRRCAVLVCRRASMARCCSRSGLQATWMCQRCSAAMCAVRHVGLHARVTSGVLLAEVGGAVEVKYGTAGPLGLLGGEVQHGRRD